MRLILTKLQKCYVGEKTTAVSFSEEVDWLKLKVKQPFDHKSCFHGPMIFMSQESSSESDIKYHSKYVYTYVCVLSL